jgi:7-cyano-7-deazaguanine synthase
MTALVLFSGGQDSTTCLAWALSRYQQVETIGFNYGQRHQAELYCRPKVLAELRRQFPHWAGRLGPDQVVDLTVLKTLGDTALTAEVDIQLMASGLPNTFVPGRNLLFFTVAAAVAYRKGLKHLVGGMCEADFAGYPDCRDDTLKALQAVINLGMGSQLVIDTPLMEIDKAGTWLLADTLGRDKLVDIIRMHTHTCYLNERLPHAWGFGCGKCPACQLRARGHWKFLGEDRE